MTATISILIPIRDAERTLADALDSLRAETRTDMEFVTVDDGSVDNTRSILKDYQAMDPRFVVVEKSRTGIVDTLNTALEVAKGDLIGRHDADDLSVSGRLGRQAHFLSCNPEFDLVATNCEIFREEGPARSGMKRWADWSNSLLDHQAMFRERFVEAPFAHPAIMIRTRTLREIGGYRSGDFPEDYELWLRMFADGRRFARLNELGVRVRDHERRSIRLQPQYRPEAFLNLKLDYLKRDLLRGASEILIYGAGTVARRWARALVQNGYRVLALADINPRRIGKRIDGIPVLAMEDVGPDSEYARAPAIGAVGKPGAREEMRLELAAWGREETVDFLFVA